MEYRKWNQNERNRKTGGHTKSNSFIESYDEYCTYEWIISAAITVLSLFSGVLIQLLIYNIFEVRLEDVPTVLLIVLWAGLSTVVTHITNSLNL